MSYFHKHSHKQPPIYEPENCRSSHHKPPKKNMQHPKCQIKQNKNSKQSQYNELHLFDNSQNKPLMQLKPQKDIVKTIPERDIPGLMFEGENSMEELLNSSINQFTKYLSDRDPLQQQHQQLVAQNKDLRKTLDKLKIIIKEKLVSALSKQRQELNAVMEDYVQLITKLLADKQQLTSALEQLEAKSSATQHKYQQLLKSHNEVKNKVQQLSKDRQQHISKTKKQIDDFLMIIQQYQEQADEEGKERSQLKQKITSLQQELNKARKETNKICHPQKTQDLLQLLQRAQEQNKNLRAQFNHEKEAIQKQHQEQFVQYERAMQETINKKDQCIAHLKTIIENMRSQRSRDKSFTKNFDTDMIQQ